MKDHKLAAIVFTDIVGYTKQMEADEEATMKLLSKQREIVFPLVKEFGGEVIKEIGDGLLMMFNSANRAVRFAMAIQEKLKDEELTIASSSAMAYQDIGIIMDIDNFKGLKRDGNVPPGDRIFRLPYLDPQGNMTISQWNTAALATDYGGHRA